MGWKHLLPRKRPGVIRRSSEVEREKAQRSTSAGEFSSDDFDVSSNGRPSGSGREKSSTVAALGEEAFAAVNLFQKSLNEMYESEPIHSPISEERKSIEDGIKLLTGESLSTPMASRLEKFTECLCAPNVDMTALRELSWRGIPAPARPIAWRLLLGYLPQNRERRITMLRRKRAEYWENVERDFNISDNDRSKEQLAIIRQIRVDVPRTSPDVPLFQHPKLQKSLERILYVWALRHTATLYVQGINDLVTPFLATFLVEVSEEELKGVLTGEEGIGAPFHDPKDIRAKRTPVQSHEPSSGEVIESYRDIELPSTAILNDIEADAYHCMTKLVDFIQNNYTPNQPEIQRSVYKLRVIVSKVCRELYDHFATQQLEFIQFAFRWFNCLLMRELPLRLIVRLWDTYLAEGKAFASLHIYVCAALIVKLKSQLLKLEFQDLIVFLQNLPTSTWTERDVEELCSMAFYYRSVYGDTPAHLRS